MKIAILGGGISGLAAGRLLAGDGHDVHILEASARIAGLCGSTEVEGFTFDLAGGHILFSKNRDVLAWMQEMAGGMERLVRKDRQTRILWHDRYVPYPFENGIGCLTPEAIADCLAGYVRAHVDRRLGTPCPADFRNWILWKMGEGFARHFMFPYNEKIWECDLSRMSSQWVEGRVPDAPLEDIVRAAVGLKTEGYAHQAIFFYPLTGGFQAISEGVAEAVRDRVRLRTPAESVRRASGGWRVNDEAFDLVINTIPLPELVRVMHGVPEDLAAEIAELRPISLANVLFGVRAEEPPEDLSWVYLPFQDQGPANRVTFFSNYSPRNAPEGHASFMAEATYRGSLQVTEAWLDDLEASMVRCGFFRRGARVVRTFHCSRYAYIDQDLDFPRRIAAARSWFDRSGLLTFGRFGRYEYHNSDQCVARAFEVRDMVRRAASSGRPVEVAFS